MNNANFYLCNKPEGSQTETCTYMELSSNQPTMLNYIDIGCNALIAIVAITPALYKFWHFFPKNWIRLTQGKIVYSSIDDSGRPNKLAFSLSLQNRKDIYFTIQSLHFVLFNKKHKSILALKFIPETSANNDTKEINTDLLPNQSKSFYLQPYFPQLSDVSLDNHFRFLSENPDFFKKILQQEDVAYAKIELKTNINILTFNLNKEDFKYSVDHLKGFNQCPFSYQQE